MKVTHPVILSLAGHVQKPAQHKNTEREGGKREKQSKESFIKNITNKGEERETTCF